MKCRRVPNFWTYSAMAVGFFLAFLDCGPPGAAAYLLRVGSVCILLFPAFYLRLMGGGDVKWIAFLIGCLGVSSGIFILFYGCVFGAFYALVQFFSSDRRSLRDPMAWFGEKEGVPLVTCLFLGYLAETFLNVVSKI